MERYYFAIYEGSSLNEESRIAFINFYETEGIYKNLVWTNQFWLEKYKNIQDEAHCPRRRAYSTMELAHDFLKLLQGLEPKRGFYQAIACSDPGFVI